MHWLIRKSAGAPPQKVALPEAIVPDAAFAVDGLGMGAWSRTHRTLTLTHASGLERNVRVRSSTVSRFDGDAETQVAFEYVLGSPYGVRSFAGTAEPFVPGQESRGRAAAGKALHVRSQITGKVLKILVKIGDKVAPGETLLIVEAMKMENRIFAAQGGVVAQISVKEGDPVATGKELVRLAND